jgi:hypothetical protein
MTPTLLLNIAASVGLGFLVALVHTYKNTYTKNFLIVLMTLPLLVQLVIVIVNGNLGTGVAVMGAFSLVRFRSVPGSSRDLLSVFWAMGIGLATASNNLPVAIVFSIVAAIMVITLSTVKFGQSNEFNRRLVKIQISEDLDFPDLFAEEFATFTTEAEYVGAKTTNMGSLYELRYQVLLKDLKDEKAFMDAIRIKNGNLPVFSAKVAVDDKL